MSTMLLSAIFFGIMGYLVKLLTGYLPAEEIALARFVLALAVILGFRLFRIIKFQFTNVPLLILRGVLGGLLIYSYKFVNVLEGGTISMATVPVAVVLAVAFLGETITLPFLTGASLVFGSTIYLLHSHPGEIIR